MTEEFEGMRMAAKDALRRAQVLFEKSYNNSHQNIEFEVGEHVLVNIHSMNLPESKERGNKFEWKCEGPSEITESVGSVAYRLRIPHSYNIHPVISILHLERYIEPDGKNKGKEMPYLRDDPKEYSIIEIVDQKRIKYSASGKSKYKTLYKCNQEGYGITEEWIPEEHLRNAPEVLKKWKLRWKQGCAWTTKCTACDSGLPTSGFGGWPENKKW
jgi:hypothetical protein